MLDKLRKLGVLDDRVVSEVNALWKYGVLRVFDVRVRSSLVDFLENQAPIEFFTVSASRSVEHHPSWQQREAGILRNTVECCLVVDRQLRMYPQFTDKDCNVLPEHRDIVLTATILSDTFKYRLDQRTVPSTLDFAPDHGRLAAELWKPLAEAHGVEKPIIEFVCEAIWWHLGRWTPGWTPHLRFSLYTEITHRIDMFMSDKNLELLYRAREIIP
jgi:hypothetical protein